MFSKSQTREVGAGIPSRALTFSLAVHVAVLAWLCWQPEPMLIQRVSIMAGDNGSSLGVVYLPTDSSLRLPVNEESNSLKYAVARKRSFKRPSAGLRLRIRATNILLTPRCRLLPWDLPTERQSGDRC